MLPPAGPRLSSTPPSASFYGVRVDKAELRRGITCHTRSRKDTSHDRVEHEAAEHPAPGRDGRERGCRAGFSPAATRDTSILQTRQPSDPADPHYVRMDLAAVPAYYDRIRADAETSAEPDDLDALRRAGR